MFKYYKKKYHSVCLPISEQLPIGTIVVALPDGISDHRIIGVAVGDYGWWSIDKDLLSAGWTRCRKPRAKR